ncbi:hypothetical protein [Agromyces sp. Soil535]|uniref:hypothetical protein n=1 Tax=Agromyces sp. Soil535 TaxID=1736390 RepID=UPI0006FF5762|nr:hypothetical protein [Agromyces sp. Soil535]KRE31258.1 hypothetical protein ASG80_02050 [Agromyces sp. Soil535]
MAVTEAPYQADSTDSDSSFQPDPGEALIEEARQRARARRRRYRGVGILVSIAAVAAIAATVAVMGSGPSSVDRPVLDSPAGAGAPVADPPDADATLVASWGQFHAGWVLVYGDGRVIRYPDYAGAGMAVVDRSRYAAIVERRLTPAGLELVRSGALVVSQLMWAKIVQDDVWAEAEWRPYVPAEYAVCHADWTTTPPYRWADASSVFAELPPEARTLLRDRERQYTAVSFAPAFEPSELEGPVGCFALTTDEADRLVEVSYQPDLRRIRAEGDGLRFVGERRVVEMWITPVMPHGEFVLGGG